MPASLGPWPARVTWGLLPLLVGPALGEALDGRSGAVTTTATVIAWTAWAGVLAATAVLRPWSLTVLRVAAPVGLVVATWAGAAGEQRAVDVLAVAWGALVVLAALSPRTGDVFVDGASYGNERRMLLRAPTPLLMGPVPLAWVALAGPVVGGPLLLAAEQWVAGGFLVLVGVPLAVVAGRALHGLARRWVVFVPAGVVLHDLQALVDPVLFPRARIARLGPAPDQPLGDDGLDLTLGTVGLVLQLDLREPHEVAPRRRDRSVEVVPVIAVRFTPTRLVALLAEAEARRIPVG